MSNENLNLCKAIVEELKKYVNGNYYRCAECGETFELKDEDDFPNMCLSCGSEVDRNESEELSLWDYFEENMLDIDWVLGSNFEYKACRIMIAFGGPTIYISTYDKQVELYWWSETTTCSLPYNIISVIDEWAEEYFGCVKGVR